MRYPNLHIVNFKLKNHFHHIETYEIDLLELEFDQDNLKIMNLSAFELKEGIKNINAYKNLLNQQINVKSLQASHIDVLDHMCVGFSFKRETIYKKDHPTPNMQKLQSCTTWPILILISCNYFKYLE